MAKDVRVLPKGGSTLATPISVPVIKQCATCRCWVPAKDDGTTVQVMVQTGECRAHPKQAIANSMGHVAWRYPVQLATEGCEEYRPK